MKTFVEFIRPTKSNPEGIATVVEVKSRDLADLDIPRMTDIFYFYDADKPDGRQYNKSPLHIIAVQMLDREEAKELLVPGHRLRNPKNFSWDPRLEAHDLFALTRNNNIEVVTSKNIVLDTRKNQVWPKPSPKLSAAFNDKFNPALTKNIKPMKPPRFRPPRP